ncbi:phage sal3 [Salmonella enterica subsp. enterica serovar Typhimurium]
MKLTPIIAALRSRCPRFENRVGGAAQFKAIPEAGKLRLPAAYVVPAEDVTGEQKSQTDYWQDLTEGFSVIVVLSNERDEKGQWALRRSSRRQAGNLEGAAGVGAGSRRCMKFSMRVGCFSI